MTSPEQADPCVEASDPTPDSPLALLGDRTGAVWTREQALQVVTAGEIDVRVRQGVWQVAWPGVYADGGFDLDAEQQAFAAVLASGGAGQPRAHGPRNTATGVRPERLVAVASGRTAARVWQLPLVDDDDPATGAQDHLHHDVAVLVQAGDLRWGGRVLHRHQPAFAAGDVVRLPSGLWATSALRTLIDCRLLLTHEALVCAMDDALHRELVSPSRLAAACTRIRGWRAAPAFRRAADLADGRAESPGETLTRLVLQPVLPGLVPQVSLWDDAVRLLAVFDLADEALMLAVEFDGRVGHEGGAMVARDRHRDRSAEARGWTTERVTWFEVRRQQASLQRRVTETATRLREAPGRCPSQAPT